uniref:Uncharacterized protein n=1 Tax=Lygus hesperus TaxID=30085 RepID=A0A0K8S5Z5_LYGHE
MNVSLEEEAGGCVENLVALWRRAQIDEVKNISCDCLLVSPVSTSTEVLHFNRQNVFAKGQTHELRRCHQSTGPMKSVCFSYPSLKRTRRYGTAMSKSFTTLRRKRKNGTP